MLTSAQIRSMFLEFFRSKGHTIVPSAPIVIKNDPTLLFTNAGMNQFKDFFLGNQTAPYRRAVDTQKCLRVSGKHNDLEEVGVDTYHHTMFEMLGNWSFGDYFKKEAIAWSWELLTQGYGIAADRMYVTVFQGDAKENLPRDQEALEEWARWVPAERILMGSKKDNFWEMGDSGPCGPCTEIHVDCRSPQQRQNGPSGADLVNRDHPEVIEIWNNVFIQFNRLKDGRLEPLPARHVDTGMGLERLTRIIQGKSSNYDTDLFMPTIRAVEKYTGHHYRGGDSKADVAFRVLADHIRAISCTIADGQLPSNTGAGYVIRRILRRAVRYYYSYLDRHQPLLYLLVEGVALHFQEVFPELQHQAEFITRVVREEEEAFLKTLEKGLRKMEDIIRQARIEGRIGGKAAFELFDTYGFPLDLTRLIAEENQLKVDEEAFGKELEEQKQRSRAATAIDTEDWIILEKDGGSEFVGYDQLSVESRVVKYRKVSAKGKIAFQIVLEKTPFYAESGGQVGDTGALIFGTETLKVLDTKKENDLVIQFADRLPKNMAGRVTARVDEGRRHETACHHTATHLLHAALRRVLGTHVQQKGSLVTDDSLRFDFSHFSKVSEAELLQIEQLVNEKIRADIPVGIQTMSKESAMGLGAMALFGEKYGDQVRVVTTGPDFSVELCGGTHVPRTGQLGYFKVLHETAVSAGVRRIEAVCSASAAQFLSGQSELMQRLRELLKFPADLMRATEGLIAETASLKKRLESLEAKSVQALSRDLIQSARLLGPVHFIGARLEEPASMDMLKKLSQEIRAQLSHYLLVLASTSDAKAQVLVALDPETAELRGLDAGRIIKEKVAPLIQGGGGGQKTLATAGGQDASRLDQVVQVVQTLLS